MVEVLAHGLGHVKPEVATLGGEATRESELPMFNPDEDQLIGELGFVTTRIAGSDRPGEVQINFRGGSETFIAYGDEAIERGEKILVVGRRPGRALEVTTFPS